MDVRINQVTSNVHVGDNQSLLSPEVMDEIVRTVLERLRQEEAEREARQNDRSIDRPYLSR
jgi:hypothetical protein